MEVETKKIGNEENMDAYFQANRHEMLGYIPQSASKILDIGCASGSFGQLLKIKNSAEVWGIEPNEKAAKMADQRLDKVICDVFHCQLDLPEKYFDCIVFNDVLEHLINPYAALTVVKKFLTYNGAVVASIPNVRYFGNIWNLLVDKTWEYTEEGVLDKTHLRFFTYKSMISTFENVGYTVSCIEGINPLDEIDPQLLKRFRCLKLVFRDYVEDMRYMQFAIVASIKH